MMFFKNIKFLCVFLLVLNTQIAFAEPIFTGTTVADSVLRTDVLNSVNLLFQKQYHCPIQKIHIDHSYTKMGENPSVCENNNQKKWHPACIQSVAEVWSIRGCQQSEYMLVTFYPDEKGETEFRISYEPTQKNETYLGQRVINLPYVVDGGKEIFVRYSQGGPLPAESSEIKINGADAMASVKQGHPEESELRWGFIFTLKDKSLKTSRVQVDIVNSPESLLRLVDDTQPMIKNGQWLGKSKSTPMTEEIIPWFYRRGDSRFMFKFTITLTTGQTIVLYQLSWFSEYSKNIFKQMIFPEK